MAKSKYSYFRSFVPILAIKTLQASSFSKHAEDALDMSEQDLVILLVDISGFTRLSDCFQGLGQAGIEALTTTINNVFSVILEHLECWGGDVVKFAGDAVIVVWETSKHPSALQRIIVHAIECARALEKNHGIFQASIPSTPEVSPAEAVERYFESLPPPTGAHRFYLTDAETRAVMSALRRVPWLASLPDHEIVALADGCCCLRAFQRGEVLIAQGR
jgi:class 3 adenylate cyclase